MDRPIGTRRDDEVEQEVPCLGLAVVERDLEQLDGIEETLHELCIHQHPHVLTRGDCFDVRLAHTHGRMQGASANLAVVDGELIDRRVEFVVLVSALHSGHGGERPGVAEVVDIGPRRCVHGGGYEHLVDIGSFPEQFVEGERPTGAGEVHLHVAVLRGVPLEHRVTVSYCTDGRIGRDDG